MSNPTELAEKLDSFEFDQFLGQLKAYSEVWVEESDEYQIYNAAYEWLKLMKAAIVSRDTEITELKRLRK